ncbi:aminotransferase class I/II-fold pyridoxal phosphate-dependent enzyme [Candidatus Bathyarchaeota archaeon]|nr:aminotransferase class I/II-fold pyridoxal phosphate-dependent enzyme [Candidatus Bathyarchaeota archaeon]
MKSLGTETAFEVLAKAKALEKKGKDIVHLEIGEPDFDTPKNIKDAAIRAIHDGYTHYVPAAGIPEFRETIARYMSETRKIEVNADEVVVTPGAKPIMFFAILALVDSGDEVLNLNPGFPIYESVINFVGARPIPIPLLEENNFRFDSESIKEKVTDKTKMIVLNSPENPTGGVLTRDDLKTVAESIEDRDDVFVVSDEIYSRIIYEREHESIVSIPGMKERTILLDGFSKTYAMTGWRLGYGVMRKDIAEKITQLMVNSNSCTCAFTQMAGIEALTGPQDASARMVSQFKRRRDVIVSGLNEIEGISCKEPRGAFYVFPNVTGTGMDCRKLSDCLLNEAGVAVLPGTSFGEFGDGYLRLSFANSVENIEKALERMSEAIGSP